jgi:hypothetical protein
MNAQEYNDVEKIEISKFPRFLLPVQYCFPYYQLMDGEEGSSPTLGLKDKDETIVLS